MVDAVQHLKIPNFRGVFLRDTLPKRPNQKECGILNLDSSNGRGTHWVAWFKNKEDKYYFDNYGVQPPNEMIKYLQSNFIQHRTNSASRSSLLWSFVSVCFKRDEQRKGTSRNHQWFVLKKY